MYEQEIAFLHSLFPERTTIPLHEPKFAGREKEYVADTIDSTFVSSVGAYVDSLEEELCKYSGSHFAVATVNGTAALHAALLTAGVGPEDEVISQPLSFVATANAVSYCGARPVFVDVDHRTMGLSPEALEAFLKENSEQKDNACRNRGTGRRIAACLPMHTFGHPCRIEEIAAICRKYNIPLIEDAAESLGSSHQGRATGTFGLAGVYSFNGNKIITAGGGGAIVTDEEEFARRAKHLTTTAKIPHSYFYGHDTLGYNYRLPNLNAALACAQLENLEFFLANKRELAGLYSSFFAGHPTIKYMPEPEGSRSNYWLNTVLLPDKESRDTFLEETNQAKVLTRPAWNLLNTLPMCRECQTDGIKNARWLGARLVNLPSSVRL